MRKHLLAVLNAALLAAAIPAKPAENPVGKAVQRLHLTPQQLLSLRDFLGAFSRGVEVDATEGGLFILRDRNSMAYAGEFALRVRSDGALQVDRVTGRATLDLSRTVQVPMRLLAKARGQVLADLSGSQMLAPRAADDAAADGEPVAPTSMLPALQMAGLRPAAAGDASPLMQSRAVFFRDGSGVFATVRTATDGAASANAPIAPMRVVARYYAALRSDGTRAWRDAVSEFDSDMQLRIADLEARSGCTGEGACVGPRGLPASTGFHMIRWQHQLIAGVPPTLLAQLAPSPAPATPEPEESDEAPAQTPIPTQPATPPSSLPQL